MVHDMQLAADWETLEKAADPTLVTNPIFAEGVHLTATLLRKNADYGSSVYKQPVLAPGVDVATAIRVRMSDKIERLRNLLASPLQANRVITESIDDTMRDLAGYAILWLARPQSLPASAPEKEEG